MRKKLLEKSVDALIEKAGDGFDLARAQRASADRQQVSADQQHVSAAKLEKLSDSLLSDAIEIKGEMEADRVAATRHPRRAPGKS
jgi:hypothetical protein